MLEIKPLHRDARGTKATYLFIFNEPASFCHPAHYDEQQQLLQQQHQQYSNTQSSSSLTLYV